MSGTVYTMDTYITSSNATNAARDGFSAISKFLDSCGSLTRIASSGSFGATGEVDASPEQSFGVWRSVSSSIAYDVILKWSYATNWTFWRPGSTTSYGLGLLTGIHSSGQAWNGTTTNFGDLPPTSPFKSDSIVYSRPNAIGGTALATGSRNSFNILNSGQTNPNGRVIGSVDNDSINIFFSNNNVATSWTSCLIWSSFVPFNANYNLPFIFYIGTQNLMKNNIFSSRTETATSPNGAFSYIWPQGNVSGSLPFVEQFRTDFNTLQGPTPITSSFLPNMQEMPILVAAHETGGEFVGYLETVRHVHNQIPNGSRINSGSRFVITGSGGAYSNISIPWNNRTYATGTYYSDPALFLTGSSSPLYVFGGLPRTIDRLGTTDAIISVISQSIGASQTLYRGFYAGNYVYSIDTPPSPATDIVVIRRT